MSSAHAQSAPAWQTDELQEEWPEEEEEEEEDDIANNMSYGTQSVSLTVPLSTQIQSTVDYERDATSPASPPPAVGTFLVREEIAHAPLLPKTPGRNKKGLVKDFFTPLPLEMMFEPPSPPQPTEQQPQPSTSRIETDPTAASATSPTEHDAELDDEIVETDMPNMNSFHGRKASMACQFTFSVPRNISPPSRGTPSGAFPQAQSTPNPPVPPLKTGPPATDPRLRLFQFQYDTYTREHLSALVDSIAVNTPSGSGTGTTATPTSFSNGLSRVSEASTPANVSHLRSAKRLKLSPSSELLDELAPPQATITRPPIYGKDYVGASRSLMEQIKQARDFSTISTVASAESKSPSTVKETPNNDTHDRHLNRKIDSSPSSRRPSFLAVPEQTSNNPSTSSGTIGSKSVSYSSIGYRQKAAALMEQIKGDVKRQKRVFSGDSELSHVTTHVEDNTNSSFGGSIKIGPDGKENHAHSHRRTSSRSSSSRSRPSPRKASKRGTEELAHNLSRLSMEEQRPVVHVTLVPEPPRARTPQPQAPPPSTLAPPAYPSTSLRITASDDLNRFVSSSTTASGTTLTAGNAPSFVKHAGPAHIRTIAPGDLPALPEQLGDMMFDKVMMRWVKNTARATRDAAEKSLSQAGEMSDDPFGDIESLRDDSRPAQVPALPNDEDEVEREYVRSGEAVGIDAGGTAAEMSIIEEQSEVDEEELELSNFSTDASAHIVNIMTGVDTDGYDDATTDSDDADDDLHTATQREINDIDFDSEFDDSPSRNSLRSTRSAFHSPQRSHSQHSHSHSHSHSHLRAFAHASPQRQSQQQQQQHQHQQQQFLSVQTQIITQTTTLSTPNRGSTSGAAGTPVIKSALKTPKNSVGATPNSVLRSADRRYYQTPMQRLVHARSVSFSDGKREGPIQGVTISGGAVQSTRSKRIADMLDALEDSDIEEDESPSKGSSAGRLGELQPLSARPRRPSSSAVGASTSSVAGSSISAGTAGSPRRVFSRSFSRRTPTGRQLTGGADATFLTECSFGVAHDRLVAVITDVQPYEPHWDALQRIDLEGAKLESVARLKEFLPRLDTLNLNRNELAWLSGIPASVRTLSVAHNCLTGITSYSHLLNLENLDVSHNDVESLRQLECLRHLRELKADGNRIASLDGLQHMDGLVKLSVQGNAIADVDFAEYRWSRLEMLNMSHNKLTGTHGIASLQALIALNLDENGLEELTVERTMPRLRILRVSGNRLQTLDVGALPSLRTLYADNNALAGLGNVDRLAKLENLSLRNQSGRGLKLSTRDVRDVKRLYLSGNALEGDFLLEPCYNLVYLELASCRLRRLPEGMGKMVPNLRALNLNYNFLEDVRPLEGLTRLQKLTIVGSRLKHTKPLIRLVRQMPEAELLDFRMNPCTLGWYLPVLGQGKEWQEVDGRFRRGLPDGAYMGRLAYRGLVMGACAGVVVLDGVVVGSKERAKAGRLLAELNLVPGGRAGSRAGAD